MLLPEVLWLSKALSQTIFRIQCSWAYYFFLYCVSDLLWWFCAASPSLLPVLTPRCPPGQGGWCPHGTFQTSCGTGGGPHLARTGWLTCGLGQAGGPGLPSSAASSWQNQPWRSDGWVRKKAEEQFIHHMNLVELRFLALCEKAFQKTDQTFSPLTSNPKSIKHDNIWGDQTPHWPPVNQGDKWQ